MSRNVSEMNLRPGHVNRDVSESELNVRLLLFPRLPSEGRFVRRRSGVDGDASPSAGEGGGGVGGAENLSKIK